MSPTVMRSLGAGRLSAPQADDGRRNGAIMKPVAAAPCWRKLRLVNRGEKEWFMTRTVSVAKCRSPHAPRLCPQRTAPAGPRRVAPSQKLSRHGQVSFASAWAD